MSTDTRQVGIEEQDRTLSDLLETYRHHQADPSVPDEKKERAAERIQPVWGKLARLQDPDGFINFVSEVIQREYQRRHHSDGDPNLTVRTKPLCRCSLPRHVCEAKQGEVPSQIRTQDLKYIQKPDSRTLTRDYVQEHSGDVVVREAVQEFLGLRAECYAELNEINVMMMSSEPLDGEGSQDGHEGPHAPEGEPGDVQPVESSGDAHAATASPDGGGEVVDE